MEASVKNPFRAAAPRIDRIEETVARMIDDLNRIGGAFRKEPAYVVELERITVYGSQAIVANGNCVLLWRKGVPKRLLQDSSYFPHWSEEEWAFFVAAVNPGEPMPFFHVLSVHGEISLAIQELVARASQGRETARQASMAA